MVTRHPWRALQDATRRRLLTRTGALFVILTIAMTRMGAPLKNPAAPWGIVSFELAWTGERATRVLESWSPQLRSVAEQSLKLDFTYILAYAVAFSLGCALVADHAGVRRAGLQRLAALASWGVLAAGACDVIENLALMSELGQSASAEALGGAAVAAGLVATVKFLLLSVCVIVLLTGVADYAAHRPIENA